ncbi:MULTISPECIES: L-idonate 5-dehydrogenase [unclassified Bradyrhizobium]|uniref:L-idonate 5-dehydrogenase n=1 Tax=unclassified Bradyrhizobium TaxID=2631580 RepID=UPI001CD1CB74|nr:MULTISPECIES: L-idonate 5-dehydrogenase [unclassified Bradyrhizobium]MCA1428243.1 L-idonate 5-dehydrogenase [Bradyrhizobium sp. NBAIM16]MCA1504676.1 L-idonate 5-dehydrogenase [Bradyrhizobium sp. NBAIM02]
MRAVVIHAPKDLRIDNFADPAPGLGEVRVKIANGGICGSDLHYYHHGGFGVVRIQQPMALGHEIAGVVADVGDGVANVRPGTRVAVNPSKPCGACLHCQEGMRNQCLDMRFLGSAMRFPHVQGGFREFITVDATQAVPISDKLSLAEAAVAEPLAVCLHAGKQAGPLLGKRVLITGCGPIGALMILVSRFGGASEIVVTDVADAPLAVAKKLGATHAINVATNATALDPWRAGKGVFDTLFEASGNQAALRTALDVLRPGATLVQLGLGGEMTLPINSIVAKELQLRGTFRFDPEFELAVRLMGDGLIDVKPLITATMPFENAAAAFELASDRAQSMKVQLTF